MAFPGERHRISPDGQLSGVTTTILTDNGQSPTREQLLAMIDIQKHYGGRKVVEQGGLPNPELYYRLGILPTSEAHLLTRRIFDSGMRTESWIYGYAVLSQDQDSGVNKRFLRERATISMGGGLTEKTNDLLAKIADVRTLGIPVVHTYGSDGKATIYQEFIENDQTALALQQIRAAQGIDDEGMKHLDQLIAIGARFDAAGYPTINFIDDLIFDGDRQSFACIDIGWDTGRRGTTATTNARDRLLRTFRTHTSYIEGRYALERDTIR